MKSGEVREEQLDAAVMRVLETKWDLGLFQDAFARCDEERAAAVHLSADHRQLAREAARESVVLLKNDSQLLPLAKHGNNRGHRPAWRTVGGTCSAAGSRRVMRR